MWTLRELRPTPRPRPGGPLERFLGRAHGRARGGHLSMTDRSELLLVEYARLADRHGEAALVRHFDRVYVAIQNALDAHGPEV